MSWPNANNECKRLGGQLATIDRDVLNEFLVQYLLDVRYDAAWIGLKRCDSQWCHPDGKVSEFQKWPIGGEPDNDCVFLFTWDHVWIGKPCENALFFLCEIPGIYRDIKSYVITYLCLYQVDNRRT